MGMTSVFKTIRKGAALAAACAAVLGLFCGQAKAAELPLLAKKAINITNSADGSNRLMADTLRIEDGGSMATILDKNPTVLGTDIARTDIQSITFLNSMKTVPVRDAFDVSQDRDGSVLAWTKNAGSGKYDLYIAANGKIIAPQNCTGLFAGYTNLEEIKFNKCFDTTKTHNMAAMFLNCGAEELDLSGFETRNVRSMAWMFSSAGYVKELNVRGFHTENVTTMKGMFSYMGSLKSLSIRNFDTSLVSDMSHMFEYCTQLTSLDLMRFDTTLVRDMSFMFYRCMSLKNANIGNFLTGYVEDMSYMFGGCSSLTRLDLRKFSTRNVTDMTAMFEACQTLKELDLRSFNTSQVESMDSMFRRCINLRSLDLSSFDFSNLPESKPNTMMFEEVPASASILMPKGYSANHKTVSAGETLFFGHYEQDHVPLNGKEEIRWDVLEVKDGKALLVSHYGLDSQSFHGEYQSVSWENSNLRIWLNSTFLQNAFSAEERGAILKTNVDNSSSQNNPKWKTKAGNDTQDKIFLLSYGEVQEYFYGDSFRICEPTAYARAMGADIRLIHEDTTQAGFWWLRSPGEKTHHAAYVNFEGQCYSNAVGNQYLCVRPALWVDLDYFA